MICALMIGRSKSKGFPRKNLFKVMGRPMCEYPLIAAKKSKKVDKIFVSTDSPEIAKIAKKYNAFLIKRPKHLANDKALGDHVFEDAYFKIKKILQNENKKIKFLVLLLANAPTITGKLIDKGINILSKDASLDSAVTTSIYNMWSPLRARRLSNKKTLKPFVPFKTFGDPKKLSCDRDSQGDVFFADMSVSIIRPHCLEKLKDGLLPQKWMGQKIAPIFSWGGCDVDYKWQVPSVEFWLKEHGYKSKR